MTKRILAILLTLAMVLSLFTVNVFAADDDVETIFSYTNVGCEWHHALAPWFANYQETVDALYAALAEPDAEFRVEFETVLSNPWWYSISMFGKEINGVLTNKMPDGDPVLRCSGAKLLEALDGATGDTIVFNFQNYEPKENDDDPNVRIETEYTISVVVPKTSGDEKPETPEEPEAQVGYEVAVTLISGSKSVNGTAFSGPSIGWGSNAITSSDKLWDKYIEAVKTEGARFIMKYTISDNDGGWMNFFQANIGGVGHVGTANWEGVEHGAKSFVDELDGEVKSNQWDLLSNGSHVVTYNCSDFIALLAEHTCDTHPDGVTVDNHTALGFQSGLASGSKINITDLYIEIPKVEEPEEPVSGGYILAEGADQFSIALPVTVKLGEKVKVHVTGESSDAQFRFWLADGTTTMSSNDTMYVSTNNKLAPGEFDITWETVCEDKDGRGVNTANAILFKGISYGVNLATLKITSLTIEYNGKVYEIELSDDVIKHIEANGSVKYVKPVKPVEPEKPAKKKKTFAFAIRLSETHHGYLVNGRMLPMPHTFVGGICTVCGHPDYSSTEVETPESETMVELDGE